MGEISSSILERTKENGADHREASGPGAQWGASRFHQEVGGDQRVCHAAENHRLLQSHTIPDGGVERSSCKCIS